MSARLLGAWTTRVEPFLAQAASAVGSGAIADNFD